MGNRCVAHKSIRTSNTKVLQHVIHSAGAWLVMPKTLYSVSGFFAFLFSVAQGAFHNDYDRFRRYIEWWRQRQTELYYCGWKLENNSAYHVLVTGIRLSCFPCYNITMQFCMCSSAPGFSKTVVLSSTSHSLPKKSVLPPLLLFLSWWCDFCCYGGFLLCCLESTL